MSVKDRYTAIADALRNQYGTIDKYKLADMPKMIGGLEIENLLDPGQVFDSTTDWGDGGSRQLNGITPEKLNRVLGKTLVFSCDVEWTGWENSDSRNRIGFEYGLNHEDGKTDWWGVWCFPNTESGKQHISASYKLGDSKITSYQEGAIFDQIGKEVHVKVTNIKIVVNPVGGVVPPNLFDGRIGFEPAFVKQQGSLYSFAALHYDGDYRALLFTNSKIDLSSCSRLRLSFRAKGKGSVWTYLFGSNYSGNYIDNSKGWKLTNTWQEFSQDFSRETIPLNASFSFRTLEHNSGEVTDLKLIKLK